MKLRAVICAASGEILQSPSPPSPPAGGEGGILRAFIITATCGTSGGGGQKLVKYKSSYDTH